MKRRSRCELDVMIRESPLKHSSCRSWQDCEQAQTCNHCMTLLSDYGKTKKASPAEFSSFETRNVQRIWQSYTLDWLQLLMFKTEAIILVERMGKRLLESHACSVTCLYILCLPDSSRSQFSNRKKTCCSADLFTDQRKLFWGSLVQALPFDLLTAITGVVLQRTANGQPRIYIEQSNTRPLYRDYRPQTQTEPTFFSSC